MLYQFFKADMLYYANRVGSEGKDKTTYELATQLVLTYTGEDEVRSEPEVLFCMPQSEAKIANIVLGLSNGENDQADLAFEDLEEKLTDLVDMLWNEECNTYLLESNVSLKQNHSGSVTCFSANCS